MRWQVCTTMSGFVWFSCSFVLETLLWGHHSSLLAFTSLRAHFFLLICVLWCSRPQPSALCCLGYGFSAWVLTRFWDGQLFIAVHSEWSRASWPLHTGCQEHPPSHNHDKVTYGHCQCAPGTKLLATESSCCRSPRPRVSNTLQRWGAIHIYLNFILSPSLTSV